tara:strand:- start:380 stop:694 length:315 start_codon:yes stop_codon:yes gene_type:complete
MALTKYHNILGATSVSQTLIPAGERINRIKSISLANVHTANATVSLSLTKSGTTFYLIKSLVIPTGSTLILDDSDLISFNNNSQEFSLTITVGSSDKVDVKINT